MATIITCAYSVRLIFSGLISINIGISIQYVEDNSTNNTSPILSLSVGAIFSGCLINWIILRPLIEPCISLSMKLLAFIVTLLGGIMIITIIYINNSISINYNLLHQSSAYI